MTEPFQGHPGKQTHTQRKEKKTNDALNMCYISLHAKEVHNVKLTLRSASATAKQ